MANWLLKTEPSTFSWDDLVRAGSTTWDGVSNPTALIHLRAMKVGDQILIYHTGEERQIVGIASVRRAAYPDPKLADPKKVVVDIAPVSPVAKPVTLAQIKADPAFEGWDLLRIGRLSVVPVSAAIWKRIAQLAKMK